MYGVGGERRLTEESLDYLEGYRGARPVRVGNAAAGQLQLDMYGELLELSWRWHRRGNSPDEDYWRFLVELVDAAERWAEPDQGLWEMRGEPQHFVHSKVMCWATLNRGLRLAQECLRKAPETRWKKVREEIREAIDSEGYDEGRGVFTQSFGGKDLDAALLLIPRVDFIDYRDERMLRTTNATARTSTTRAFSNATAARASRKAPFSPAPSGWSSAWLIRDVPRTHRRSSTVRLPYPMISASSQKSTTRKRGSRWATSPRASRISPTSPPPKPSPTTLNAGCRALLPGLAPALRGWRTCSQRRARSGCSEGSWGPPLSSCECAGCGRRPPAPHRRTPRSTGGA
jgi:hypothetical protein